MGPYYIFKSGFILFVAFIETLQMSYGPNIYLNETETNSILFYLKSKLNQTQHKTKDAPRGVFCGTYVVYDKCKNHLLHSREKYSTLLIKMQVIQKNPLLREDFSCFCLVPISRILCPNLSRGIAIYLGLPLLTSSSDSSTLSVDTILHKGKDLAVSP